MAISASDLKLYQAEHHPTSDTGASGGTISAVEIDDTSIGELMPSKAAAAEGGSTRYQYQKACIKNTHATDTLTAGQFYGENFLADPTEEVPVKVRILNQTAATNTTVRIFGQSAAGVPQTEDIPLAGEYVSWVSGIQTWKSSAGGVVAALVIATDTGIIKEMATVICEVEMGSVILGYVPIGAHSAVGFINLAVEGTLNATTETTDRTTAPALTFYRALTVGTALSFAGTLNASDFQGIWAKEILYAGMANMADFEIWIKVIGESA